MNPSWIEKLKMALVGLAAALFLIYLIPSRLPEGNPYLKEEALPENAVVAPGETVPAEEEAELVVMGITGIQVKASGEDPVEQALPQENLDLHKELERRFSQNPDEEEGVTRMNYEFSIPPSLEDVVSFWVQVFGKYGKGVYLFHHKDRVDLLYSVLDLRHLDPSISGLSDQQAESYRNKALIEEKKRIQAYLAGLESKVKSGHLLDSREGELVRTFAKYPELSLKDATQREMIRIQGGFAHRFKQAIVVSGLYMNEMERIFREKGLPVELTRLPFVESAFNIKAYSSASAAGLWQFIPETGARYLKIDGIADERLDPIFATYAAAAHLKAEYSLIGDWPLTINAYNTGPGRILKAMRELKTDSIERVIREFKEPGYQFYSRNYYPEFLAALHVYENRSLYFGRLNVLPPLNYEVYSPRREVNLSDLAHLADLDEETLKDLNPALAEDVLNGVRHLPAGYLVKVPPKMGPVLAQAELMLDTDGGSVPTTQWYVAQAGDTLEDLSKKFNLPLAALERLNGYLPRETLAPGALIELPEKENVAQNPQDPALAIP